MKKSSFQALLMLTLMVITIVACNKNNKKEYVTNPPSEDTETLIAAITPINSKLPADVLKSCVVTPTDFSSWFKSKSVSKNGIVTPANSVTFTHQNNCDFYKWSEQMFLWMTSPKQEGDYKSGTVIETPAFYTVSPINVVNNVKERTLIPHVSGQMITAVANTQKNDLPIDSEEGQATDDVLIAQKNDSILYYITMVNDVYAKFVLGAKTGKLFDNEFPTTQTTLDSIETFATSIGKPLKDPETLAIEIKTSWVDVTGLSDSNDYITMDAIVPNYTKTDTLWTPNTTKPTRKAKLALIGIHIVGSTAGHPEMVWATFEHVNNAPNLSYKYLNNSTPPETITVAADTGNDWLLNDDSASSTYNQSHMKYESGDIVANTKTNPEQTITASNTKMTKPWGVADAGVPNPENASVAASNSQIISTNNSVLGQLANGDMRKNYIFIGATWTNDGAAPTGKSYSVKDTLTASGVAIGTSQLANSTMETYAQNGSAYSQYGTCFSCHSKNDGLLPTDLSHVYKEIMAGIVPKKATKTP
ncbi:hypothetical protein [uncultured Aquimarina sp.]|uniref:hypothetical protein n=1 Tax=uncultured Aquimarina sp. TaxID=575652 RepID=UPI0026107284|nr:hypothetical protein [uncultured Aquimarina sp.]